MSDTIDVPSEAQPMPEQRQSVAIRDAVNAIDALPAPVKPPVTAAQAKIEAVANLTMRAYERASELALTPQEIEKLQAEFPDEAFKPGAAGKENLIYIEHAFLRDRLNQVFGPGQWAVIPRNRWAEDFSFTNKYKQVVQASRVYVEAMLLVRGCFVAEAVGDMVYYKNNEGQNYGDAVEGAKTAALRRCCKELGVGLQAWKKDWCEGWWARKRTPRQQQAPTPQAQPTATPAKEQPQTELARVEILSVIEKQGTKKDGTPWHAYFVKFDDGIATTEAGTFSKSLGELAIELSETHEFGRIVIRPGSKPNTHEIVSLERAEQPPPPTEEDNIPMDYPPPFAPITP